MMCHAIHVSICRAALLKYSHFSLYITRLQKDKVTHTRYYVIKGKALTSFSSIRSMHFGEFAYKKPRNQWCDPIELVNGTFII